MTAGCYIIPVYPTLSHRVGWDDFQLDYSGRQHYHIYVFERMFCDLGNTMAEWLQHAVELLNFF